MASRQYGEPKDPRAAKSGGSIGSRQYGTGKLPEAKPTKEDPSPSATVVERFHKNADVDVRPESMHHTLGASSSQASPGDHTHDGGDSKKLLEGYIISGSKSNFATMAPSIIMALVRLGAKDSTTA